MDKTQQTLIAQLEQKANLLELQRNNARDRFEIAAYQSRQPNQFILRNHLLAWLLSGLVGIGGVYMEVQHELRYGGVVGAGAGLTIGLLSYNLDDQRQTRQKQELLQQRTQELEELERKLAQHVQQYREEEEIGWLMFALNISKETLLGLRDWLATPRPALSQNLLQSLDVAIADYRRSSPKAVLGWRLAQEVVYHRLSHQLLDPTLQIQKKEFMDKVETKHRVWQQLEQLQQERESTGRVATVSVVGGAAAGVAAGVAAAGVGSSLAQTFGASKNTANWVGALTGAAAVVGVGLLAVNAIGRLMEEAERKRQLREATQRRRAEAIAARLRDTLEGSAHGNRSQKVQAAKAALVLVDELQETGVPRQDPMLRQTVDALGTTLQQFLAHS